MNFLLLFATFLTVLSKSDWLKHFNSRKCIKYSPSNYFKYNNKKLKPLRGTTMCFEFAAESCCDFDNFLILSQV